VKVGPTNGRSHENLGVTYMRLGRLAEARLSFERARALLPAGDENIGKNFKVLKQVSFDQHFFRCVDFVSLLYKHSFTLHISHALLQTEIASGHSVDDVDDYYEDYDGDDLSGDMSAGRVAKQKPEINDGYEDYDDYDDDSNTVSVQV